MKQTVLRFGAYGFIVAFILFSLAVLLGKNLDDLTQQVLGYTTMVISLSFVYFGIKNYRDVNNNGLLSFGNGLKIGLMISLFSALGIALFDLLYTTMINPDFVTEYINRTLAEYEVKYSAEEFQTKKTELIKQMEDYGHPLLMAAMMFVSTLIIGLIISLISTLILKSKSV